MTTTPLVREIKPINFVFFRTEACLDQLPNFVAVSKDLLKEAVSYNLHVTGPIHWHYVDYHGDRDRPFTLEIALPVADTLAEYDGSFHFKRTDTFRCVAMTHEGSWDSMGLSYVKIHQFIASRQMKPLWLYREVYVNADFRHPDANVTEIQVGVA